eukprot:scaffold421_cov125-Isochrysis_galbana.AAC.6
MVSFSVAGSQSVNEFRAVVGAGEVMLTGTICFVQMGVVVSAIGVGKVSGIAKRSTFEFNE